MMRSQQIAELQDTMQHGKYQINGRYHFNLQPFTTETVTAPNTFLISLPMPGSETESLAPPPRTRVEINIRSPQRRRYTACVVDLGNHSSMFIDILVVVPTGGAGFVFENETSSAMTGRFKFGTWGAQTIRSRRAIAMAMYYESLNQIQRQSSFQSAVTLQGGTITSATTARLSITQGPPGTGKTHVILAIMIYCLRMRIKLQDEASAGNDRFPASWLELCKLEVQFADIVIATADVSSQRVITFKAEVVVADEAAQLKSYELINAISKHAGPDRSLKELAIVGDHRQLGPTVLLSLYNEFSAQEKRSIMSWMIDNGHDLLQLRTQYRMQPDISAYVNNAYYDGRLLNDPSVINRPYDAVWKQFAQSQWSDCNIDHSVFFDVPMVDSHYWQFGSNESIVNVNHAALIMFLLFQLCKANDIDIFTDVQIICFYTAQTSLLQTICRDAFIDGDVDVRTVGSSWGQQKKIVLSTSFVGSPVSVFFRSRPVRVWPSRGPSTRGSVSALHNSQSTKLGIRRMLGSKLFGASFIITVLEVRSSNPLSVLSNRTWAVFEGNMSLQSVAICRRSLCKLDA
ncbi:MAG: hypothetical protein Q9178_004725 [Gyalolechia marmorata]